MLHVLKRHRHVADVIDIEEIVIHSGQDVGNGPINHLVIEITDLGGNISGKITGILKIHGPHDHLEFFYGLIVDHVSLRLASVKDIFPDEILNDIHIFGREEGST